MQEYIWFRGGDLDRLQVFKKKGVGSPLWTSSIFHFDLFYFLIQKYIWFVGVDLSRLQVLKQQGDGSDP